MRGFQKRLHISKNLHELINNPLDDATVTRLHSSMIRARWRYVLSYRGVVVIACDGSDTPFILLSEGVHVEHGYVVFQQTWYVCK